MSFISNISAACSAQRFFDGQYNMGLVVNFAWRLQSGLSHGFTGTFLIIFLLLGRGLVVPQLTSFRLLLHDWPEQICDLS